MILELTFSSIDKLPEVAKNLLEAFPEERFYAFFGKMGVGKTTLIKELCARLGVTENVCSPTFAIINEYTDRDGDPVYHFDFYRIDNPAEALDIGLYDYLDSGYRCFMEWPENIDTLLPEETLRVHISVRPDGARCLAW